MSWANDNDKASRCSGPLGGVADEETVARLCIKQIPYRGYTPFRRSDFLPPKDRDVSDICGDSDGFSVDRSSRLSADDINRRTVERAARHNEARVARGQEANQFPDCAKAAVVGHLRSIRAASDDRQTVFVYDDPIAGVNDEHAIVRISDALPEEEIAGVVDDIAQAFR